MEPRKLLTGLGLLSVLLPQIALAQYDLQELIRLQGESANAAFSYAQKHRAEQEGDPDFDFYYGVAAIDTGNVSQGVFALERVLAVQPNNHAARLELARGYFILEEYARAREAQAERAGDRRAPHHRRRRGDGSAGTRAGSGRSCRAGRAHAVGAPAASARAH